MSGRLGRPAAGPVTPGGGDLRLVGATSFGAGCAQPGKPGVYPRLAEVPIRWFIQRVLGTEPFAGP